MKIKLVLALVLLNFYSFSQCLEHQFPADYRGNDIATYGDIIFTGASFYSLNGQSTINNLSSRYGTPSDIEFGPGNRLYLLDETASDLKIFEANGILSRRILINSPFRGLGVDASGKAVVGIVRGTTFSIRVLNPNCSLSQSCIDREFGIQEEPMDIEISSSGDIYVLGNSNIYIYNVAGHLQGTIKLSWPFRHYSFDIDEKNERIYTTSPKEYTGENSIIAVYNLTGELLFQKRGNDGENFYGVCSSGEKLLIANITREGSFVNVYNKFEAPPKIINIDPVDNNVNLCLVGATNLALTVTGTNLHFQWKKDGLEIPGANTAEFSISNAQKSDSGYYECVVSNFCGNPVSKGFNVNINAPLSFVNPAASFFEPLQQSKFSSISSSPKGITVWLDYSSFTEITRCTTDGAFVFAPGDYTGQLLLVYSYIPGCDYFITQNYIMGTEGRNGDLQEDNIVSSPVISPNPALNEILIEGLVGSGEIYLFNPTGDKLLEQKTSFPGILNISSLPNGLYFVRIIFNGEIYIRKLKVQH